MVRIDQIKQIAKSTAIFEPPATAEELKRCQEDLYVLDLPPMPQAYVDFLSICNGFSDGGDQSFYGTERTLKSKPNGIVSANEHNMDFFVTNKKLLIGKGGEELFVYNAADGRYEMIDDLALDVYESFKTFEELFRAVNKRW